MSNQSKLALLSLATAFSLSACIDLDAPSTTREAAPPEWTKHVTVDVRKRGADVINAHGVEFRVYSSGTYIGDGLTARRTKRTLYIRDQNGVECRWNSSETLCGCTERNPAYDAYMKAKKAAADSLKTLKR